MFSKIYNEVKYLISLKAVQDTLFLFWSFLVVTLLWIITSSIIVKNLWPENYWKFSLIMSIIAFIWLFFEFWFFSSWTRLLWIEKNKIKERSIFWTLIIITLIISIIFLLFLILSSFIFDLIIYKKEQIWKIILYTSPLLMFYPFSYMLPQALQWMNKMKLNSLYNILKPILYLLFIWFLFILNIKLSIINTITVLYFSIILSIIIIIIQIKPIFKWFQENYLILKNENKVFWKHIYLWRIFEQSTFKLDVLLIAFFLSSKEVGFYTLAFMIASPISKLSTELSRSLYKKFAQNNIIPKKVLIYNFLWLITSSIILLIIWKYLILWLFWTKFIEVWNILWLVIIAVFFQWLYQPYNFSVVNNNPKFVKKMWIIWWFINIFWNLIFIILLWIKWAILVTIFNFLFWYITYKYKYNEQL